MTPEWRSLAALARLYPAGATIPVPVVLFASLEADLGTTPDAHRLLTVADLAAHFQVSNSTARAWLADGLSPAARRLPRIGWRLPSAALPELEAALSKSASVDLGEWRKRRAA